MDDEREGLVNQIIEANRRFFHRHLEMGGGRDWVEVELTMSQLKVLFVVAVNNGVPMTQLARMAGLTLSTATGVVDRLIAQALVRREDDPDDRRLVLLMPTELGIALVDRLTQVSGERFRAIASRLSLEELRLVAQALSIIQKASLDISNEQQAASLAHE